MTPKQYMVLIAFLLMASALLGAWTVDTHEIRFSIKKVVP